MWGSQLAWTVWPMHHEPGRLFAALKYQQPFRQWRVRRAVGDARGVDIQGTYCVLRRCDKGFDNRIVTLGLAIAAVIASGDKERSNRCATSKKRHRRPPLFAGRVGALLIIKMTG